MANMSQIPGTPEWIKARGGKGSSNTDTQAQNTEKAVQEIKEDQKYTDGGEQGKAE